MKRLGFLCLILLASFAGVLSSRLAWKSVAVRNFVEKQFDLKFEDAEIANLRIASRSENIAPKLDHELSLYRAQFGDEETFLHRLEESDMTVQALLERIADQQRGLQWLEERIATKLPPTEAECQAFYDRERVAFAEPTRYRASHIFLAAPAETPPDVVETKRSQIEAIAARLAQGEAFVDLAAEASEDEATKLIGGDLGFFSPNRMPGEFLSQVEKLTPGRPSAIFRSHLGFHIVEVTETRPAAELVFEKAQKEISLAISNQRRALIAGRLADMLKSADDPSKLGSAQN